jgi:uncharacterized protein (TIGR03086 family)
MDQIATLEFGIGELRREVRALDDSEMDTVTNCEPWTIRRLASHALNNQLLWAGRVTGRQIVSVEETVGAVAYGGDLVRYADEVAEQTLAMWRRPGVLSAVHATPLGELPGSMVINFPTIDALCHAWDLSASLGRPLEFPPEWIPAVTAVVDATCNDAAREHGLIKDVVPIGEDADDTERLMARAGRGRPTVSPPAGHGRNALT